MNAAAGDARATGHGDPQRVVLLTARDPLLAPDVPPALTIAAELAGAGHAVTLVLLEDAAALARRDHRHNALVAAAVDKGVRVLAEDEALVRRGIAPLGAGAGLADGVEPASIGEAVELLLRGSDRQAWL